MNESRMVPEGWEFPWSRTELVTFEHKGSALTIERLPLERMVLVQVKIPPGEQVSSLGLPPAKYIKQEVYHSIHRQWAYDANNNLTPRETCIHFVGNIHSEDMEVYHQTTEEALSEIENLKGQGWHQVTAIFR